MLIGKRPTGAGSIAIVPDGVNCQLVLDNTTTWRIVMSGDNWPWAQQYRIQSYKSAPIRLTADTAEYIKAWQCQHPDSNNNAECGLWMLASKYVYDHVPPSIRTPSSGLILDLVDVLALVCSTFRLLPHGSSLGTSLWFHPLDS